MWPFKKGKSRRELGLELAALKGSWGSLVGRAKETERLLEDERIKTAKLALDLREIIPELESLRSSRHVAATDAATAKKALVGLVGVLRGYGLPTETEALRGHLAATEEIVFAGLRAKRERAGVVEEE